MVEPTVCKGNMTLTDIEKAKQLFQKAGLAFPTIPEELAARLKERDKWLFSTREITMSPYNLSHYVHEVNETNVDDYSLLCHSGHGVNSYALQCYLVYGALRLFLPLGWGGVYMNAKGRTAEINECFKLADEIFSLHQILGGLREGNILTIVGSSFYGSFWSTDVKFQRREDADSKKPAEVLTEVLCGLKNPSEQSDSKPEMVHP
jgi:hypothetical protein